MKIISAILILTANVFAQSTVTTTATTEDGRKVILYNNGTWKFVASKTDSVSHDLLDFRKASWGMSKSEIRKLETAKFLQEGNDNLVYSAEVAGFDCLIAYYYVESKLFRALYLFNKSHTNKNDYIDDYKRIKNEMSEKYGKPIKDETVWKNSLYANNPEQYGFAVSYGHLVYFAEWETMTTKITLALSGENYEIKLFSEYKSIKLQHLENLTKKKSEF